MPKGYEWLFTSAQYDIEIKIRICIYIYIYGAEKNKCVTGARFFVRDAAKETNEDEKGEGEGHRCHHVIVL